MAMAMATTAEAMPRITRKWSETTTFRFLGTEKMCLFRHGWLMCGASNGDTQTISIADKPSLLFSLFFILRTESIISFRTPKIAKVPTDHCVPQNSSNWCIFCCGTNRRDMVPPPLADFVETKAKILYCVGTKVASFGRMIHWVTAHAHGA